MESFLSQPGLVKTPLNDQKLDYNKLTSRLVQISTKVYGQQPEVASVCLQRPASDPNVAGEVTRVYASIKARATWATCFLGMCSLVICQQHCADSMCLRHHSHSVATYLISLSMSHPMQAMPLQNQPSVSLHRQKHAEVRCN